jgi:predicted nucleic acid-binding protein
MASSLERDRKTTATLRWPSLFSLFSPHEGRTPYNDRLRIAALAQERDATLVHKDPEFEQLEATVKVLKLPYKKNAIS